VRVDPATPTAQAQAGLSWGEFDHETQAFGLATTGGAVSMTGIAGLTLGGGVGWLMGKFGLTCDNVLSVDLVTADGRFLTANAADNDDLFWGVRGGGGNFGIATSFQYRLYPVGPVLGGMVIHPLSRARDILRFYKEYTASAPDELTAYAALLTGPDGNPIVAIILCYCGPPAEGERIVEPVKKFGPPVADLIRRMGYSEVQTMFDALFSPGQQNYWKGNLLKDLSDEAIDTIVAHSGMISPMMPVLIEHHHGALCRVGPNETAFPHREAPYDFIIMSMWSDPAESDKYLRWTRELWQAMRPYFSGGVYVNELSSDEGEDRVRAAYGANYERLLSLKNQYDPTNFFRLNQNIRPTV
jgi:FAD/FMN-containing dehydrogenase